MATLARYRVSESQQRRERAERILREWIASPDASAARFAQFLGNHAGLATELTEAAVAAGVLPTVAGPAEVPTAHEQQFAQQLLAGLGDDYAGQPRYQVVDEIGRGGMGIVLRVLDRKLQRHLAMKMIHRELDAAAAMSSGMAVRVLQRFLNEARITGQLQHPGIVPVHEVGIDAEKRAFFTMKLVQGRTLADVFDAMRSGDANWSQARVVAIVQRMCEALAYAHDRRVVHRDLKPSNVMVGDFGEVYVMDWGLARELGGTVAAEMPAAAGEPFATAGSLTRSGMVLGTPAYMPPEQAAGRLAAIDARSDIYAVGAILHELIAGYPPYCEPAPAAAAGDGALRAQSLLQRILAGPPPALRCNDVAPELVAICERAMQYEPARRYADARQLADDLRAFLEGRVVAAHATGAWAETRKWVQRNRALSAALFGVLVTAVVGASVAGSYAVEASAKALVAQRTVGEFEQLAAVVRLRAAESAERELAPAWPENVARIERWLRDDVGGLVRMMPEVERTIAALEAKATVAEQGEGGISEQSRGLLREKLADLRGAVKALQVRATVVDRVELRWARGIEAWTRAHPRAVQSWASAAAAIAAADDVVASRRYRDAGIVLAPQTGLVPIGMNPVTRLWEFYDLRSAWDGSNDPAAIAIPTHAPDGSIAVAADTGIVFVLVPGGTFTMGSQHGDATAPNYDPEPVDDDELPNVVTLAPFFVARHELTQAQWQRLGDGSNPSRWQQGSIEVAEARNRTEPVERVDWFATDLLLRRHGMQLPTEAQWEFAARGGTTTPWCYGQHRDLARDDAGVARGLVNVADQALWAIYKGIRPEPWSDGHAITAPVGWSRANGFGLFDVHGNVWEWCQDWKCDYATPARVGDGLREPGPVDAANPQSQQKVERGGGIFHAANEARCADRMNLPPDQKHEALGVRAVRRLR